MSLNLSNLKYFLGGGSAGCNTLYQLTKRNVNAVLLERGHLTCGTTWHTGDVFPHYMDVKKEYKVLTRCGHTLMILNILVKNLHFLIKKN